MQNSILQEHIRIVQFLRNLKECPPRVLVLEGGSPQDRKYLGRFWGALLNCSYHTPPCFSCDICEDIFNGRFLDMLELDGEGGFIKIEDVRAVHLEKNHKPREGKYKIFYFIFYALFQEC